VIKYSTKIEKNEGDIGK